MVRPVTPTMSIVGPLGITSVEVIVPGSGMFFGTSTLCAVRGAQIGVALAVTMALADGVGVRVRVDEGPGPGVLVRVGVRVGAVGVAVRVGHGPTVTRRPQPNSVPSSPA